jgi:hypothetical protein
MTATIVTVSLSLAISSFGLGHDHQHQCEHEHYNLLHNGHHPHHIKRDRIMPPGPGDGWGFPNDNPDMYGWVDYEVNIPLGADRTAEYYFPRYIAVPPEQMFMTTYYNPFVTRGQRYLPFSGGGGDHPAGGPPMGPATLPVSPYADEPDTPVVTIPRLSGRAEPGPNPSTTPAMSPQ